MPPILPEGAAEYTLLGRGGVAAGAETLTVVRSADGWRLASQLHTTFPASVAAVLDWELDRELGTRLLAISSIDVIGDRHELELTVTGNGLLAHRSGPDGPSQVELGWGPGVELDGISAAFPIVAIARHRLPEGEPVEISLVHLGLDSLEPVVLRQTWTTVGPGLIEVATPATGHVASLAVGRGGLLDSYSGLLRRVRV